MNFEFIRECRLESDELQTMYDNVLQELERAEHYYWRKPQECGIILRQTTERICRSFKRNVSPGKNAGGKSQTSP